MTDEAKRVPHVYLAIEEMTALLAKDGVSKGKHNKEQNYHFRGIDDFRNAIAPLQKQCGLVIVPMVKSRTSAERQTKSGGVMLHVLLEIDFRFVSTRDASELVVPAVNEAMDTGDKATNKALSQAYKNVCINLFNIPTVGEEDTDEERKKDLKSHRRTAHPGHEACDQFVTGYIRAVTEAKTKHGLAELGAVHALTLEAMKASDDEFERGRYQMCRSKHQEALDEFRKQEGEAAKGKPMTVGAALKGGADV